jgi:hypothetical protein
MLKRDTFLALLVLICSVLVVCILLAYHYLDAMRYIIAAEAVLCALAFGTEAWRCDVSWRGKGKLFLSLFPFICVLLLILPFLSRSHLYLLPEDPTDKVLNTISIIWEAGCGCLLLCFMTIFAFKVQRFYTEVAYKDGFSQSKYKA